LRGLARFIHRKRAPVPRRPHPTAKGVLTVIALLLAAIVFKQYVSPDAVALAQGQFAGVQYGGHSQGVDSFFDPRTGEVWVYELSGALFKKFRLTKLGQPLTVEK
jgi:hypothetical protein